jgi:hypothetical protein
MNLDNMVNLTDGIATKADKMRVLERAGYARADIARFLGVRYQQVRNTLEGDKRTGYSPEIIPTLAAGEDVNVTSARLRLIGIDESGFAQIPPDLMDEFDARDEGETPQLYALKVPGGLFVCTGDGLVARAAASFE